MSSDGDFHEDFDDLDTAQDTSTTEVLLFCCFNVQL